MDVYALMRLMRSYAALGWSVQEQMEDFVTGGEPGDLNPNAVKQFKRLLEDMERLNVRGAAGLVEEAEEYIS